MFSVLQILNVWYQKLPRSYTVKTFVEEVEAWQKHGYLDRSVFSVLDELVKDDTR